MPITENEYKAALESLPPFPNTIIEYNAETGEVRKEIGFYGKGAPYDGEILDLNEE